MMHTVLLHNVLHVLMVKSGLLIANQFRMIILLHNNYPVSESLETRESKQSTLLLSFISTPVVQYSLLRKCYLSHSVIKKNSKVYKFSCSI